MFYLIWFGSSLIFYILMIYKAISEYKNYGIFSVDINTIASGIILGIFGPLCLIAYIFVEFGEKKLVFYNRDIED